MDVGQLKNPFSKKTSESSSGSTGLFKIGDYDTQPASQNTNKQEEPSIVKQTAETVKNEAQSMVDKAKGQDDNVNK